MNSKKLIKGGHTSQKGITLIALVITIIVLLILAGVTISMVLGDDGIIRQAQEAKRRNEEETDKENISLALTEIKIADKAAQVSGTPPLGEEAVASALDTKLEATYGTGKVTVEKENGVWMVTIDEDENRKYPANITAGGTTQIPEPSTISFTIDGEAYTCEPGTTWTTFANANPSLGINLNLVMSLMDGGTLTTIGIERTLSSYGDVTLDVCIMDPDGYVTLPTDEIVSGAYVHRTDNPDFLRSEQIRPTPTPTPLPENLISFSISNGRDIYPTEYIAEKGWSWADFIEKGNTYGGVWLEEGGHQGDFGIEYYICTGDGFVTDEYGNKVVDYQFISDGQEYGIIE